MKFSSFQLGLCNLHLSTLNKLTYWTTILASATPSHATCYLDFQHLLVFSVLPLIAKHHGISSRRHAAISWRVPGHSLYTLYTLYIYPLPRRLHELESLLSRQFSKSMRYGLERPPPEQHGQTGKFHYINHQEILQLTKSCFNYTLCLIYMPYQQHPLAASGSRG